jgi:LacI family transcriptional regulator
MSAISTRQQRPTLRDVAEAAGVSKTTAVFVLNERPNFSIPQETRLRVQKAAQKLGYHRNGLAAALSSGRTGSIGIVIASSSDEADPQLGDDYLLGILLGANRAAANADLRLTMIAYTPTQISSPEVVTDRRVDGLILVGIQDEDYCREIYATGFPCVTVGSGYAERRITVDNRGGARAAVEHLIALGHRRIAFASPKKTEADKERGQGWRETMQQYGLPTDGWEQDWEPLFSWIISGSPDRPTAIFCRNDGYAAFLIRAARRQGLRIPEDLSVIGFDNSVVAEALDLTSVRNPLSEQMTAAVNMLSRLIAGEEIVTHITLPSELTLRRSTASPAFPYSVKEF